MGENTCEEPKTELTDYVFLSWEDLKAERLEIKEK